MLFLAELSKKRQSLIEYITICNGIKFWEETLSDNHRNSKNPLTLWELPLALTTSKQRDVMVTKAMRYRDVPKVFGHCDFLLYISCKTTFFKNIIPKSALVRF